MRVDIKPISANQAFCGRKFKTKAYKEYEETLLQILPKIDFGFKKENKLMLIMFIGLSNKLSDIDNVAKQFIDILSKAYNFNDNQIYSLVMQKEIVNKGEEYIDFSFYMHDEVNVILKKQDDTNT